MIRAYIVAMALIAAVAVGCQDDDGTSGSGEASSQGAGEEVAASGPIRFVLDPVYPPREPVEVKIENTGTRSYLYQGRYAACFLSFSDSAGHEFKVPPGTHCDILFEETIEPGEVRTLFTWRLAECLQDRWGCVKSRPLPAGTYQIRGRFKPKHGGEPAVAEASFRIAPS